MVNSNTRTLGIIFPNSYDYFVPELDWPSSDGIHPVRKPLPPH